MTLGAETRSADIVRRLDGQTRQDAILAVLVGASSDRSTAEMLGEVDDADFAMRGDPDSPAYPEWRKTQDDSDEPLPTTVG